MEAQEGKIIDEICEYVEAKHIKETFQEYLKRVVLEKPTDPIQFLLDTIQDNPFVFGQEEEAAQEEEA